MMWDCSRDRDTAQAGRVAPVIAVDVARAKWDFCRCTACDLAVGRLDRFDAFCRIIDAYVEDLRRDMLQKFGEGGIAGARVRIGHEYYAPTPARKDYPVLKGPSFTPDPGGLEVLADDRPVRHRRARMMAVWEAT